MSFRDWSDEQYEAFADAAEENILLNMSIRNEIFEEAQALFDAGWLTFGEYTPEELAAIRDRFYNLVGIDEDMFDWEEYKTLYNEAA